MGQQPAALSHVQIVQDNSTLRRPWVETVQGESKGKENARDTVTVSAAESGWGEVLGLCVIQHTVQLTKLLTPAQ